MHFFSIQNGPFSVFYIVFWNSKPDGETFFDRIKRMVRCDGSNKSRFGGKNDAKKETLKQQSASGNRCRRPLARRRRHRSLRAAALP